MTRLMIAIAAIALSVPAWGMELGDDGLHKTPWMRDTFKDLGEDLAEANVEGKRLMLIFEQRGCIYCTEMHEKVFPDPEITSYIEDNYFVVQLNLHGDIEITDLDGEVLTEKQAARKWGIMFTPSMVFLPEEVSGDDPATREAVAVMPGAFGKGTTIDLLTWINEKRYEDQSEEDFQRYHARRIQERANGSTD
jgi:thioredoxin-related protein